MKVWGSDYNTKDGTCVRDYIHVCDIAHAHTLALKFLEKENNKTNCEIFNLGTGTGYTVLEVIKSFEKVSGVSLNYTLAERRAGDVIAIYANNDKAKNELGWHTKYNVEDMMHSAWEWEKKVQS
jgi:UDP-glucose 4-epimerase